MSKVKVVQKTPKLDGLDIEGVTAIFNQMLGKDDVNLNITVPRFHKYKSLTDKIITLLNLFFGDKSLIFREVSELNKKVQDVQKFISKIEEQQKDIFSNLDKFANLFKQSEIGFTNLNEEFSGEIKNEFFEVYTRVKKSRLINICITICGSLVNYAKFIENEDDLSDKFLTGSGSVDIFPFTDIDLHYVYTALNTDIARKFTLKSLSKIYQISMKIYNEYMDPDIDVDNFISIMMSAMGHLKKAVPRCDKAFSKIENSVHIFKRNFSNYYKDYVNSDGNDSIIMQNFIVDVSANTHADSETMRQFKVIMNHYRKLSMQNHPNDKKLQKLFNMTNSSIDKFDSSCKDATEGIVEGATSENTSSCENNTICENNTEDIAENATNETQTTTGYSSFDVTNTPISGYSSFEDKNSDKINPAKSVEIKSKEEIYEETKKLYDEEIYPTCDKPTLKKMKAHFEQLNKVLGAMEEFEKKEESNMAIKLKVQFSVLEEKVKQYESALYKNNNHNRGGRKTRR